MHGAASSIVSVICIFQWKSYEAITASSTTAWTHFGPATLSRISMQSEYNMIV